MGGRNTHHKTTSTIDLLYLLFWPHVTYCYYNRFLPVSSSGRPIRGGEKMSTVWAQRREELLSDCIVSPDVFTQMVDRLGAFVVPYQHALETEAGSHYMHFYRIFPPLLGRLPRITLSNHWCYEAARGE